MSWLQTLSKLVHENDQADTLLALERWIEERPGYAVTFGKALQSDGSRVFAVAIAMPNNGLHPEGQSVQIQMSSRDGLNVALSDAMSRVTAIEFGQQAKRRRESEQLQPAAVASVGEVLRSLTAQWGKPAS